MPRIRSVIQTLRAPDERPDPRVHAIELRLDLYPGVDVARFVAAADRPVIATVRRVRDGGAFDGDEAARARLFAGAAAAAWVDVESDAAPDLAPAGPRRLVSHHDLAACPADLSALFAACRARGADRVKIAATPADSTAAFALLDLPEPGLGLGDAGAFTRVLARHTYCAAAPLAPGMPTPGELFDLYGVDALPARPRLFGVVGDPVAHSKSPDLHNPWLRREGRGGVYLRFVARELAPFFRAFRAHGGAGLSVTAPLKTQAAALATAPDADVVASGAANTLLADGRAYNTDLLAFLELVPPGRGDACVMGAGGAARAAVVALRRLGYAPRVWARRPEAAAALGAPVAARPDGAPLVVNACPAPPPAAPFVVDLRYGPDIAPPARGVSGETFLAVQARHQEARFRDA